MPLRGPLSLLDDARPRVRVPARLFTSVVAAAVALLAVGALQPVLGVPVLFPAFVAIVFVGAKIAGTPYGIMTMALFGGGYAAFYGPESLQALGLNGWHLTATLVTYSLAGFVVARIGGALRDANLRLRAEHLAAKAMHEQREDLLKALTHDIRTPLGAITMHAGLLARAPNEPAAVLRRARSIQKSVDTVAAMLGDLVETAYLESGHLRLERQPVDLARFAIELLTRLDGALPVDRVELAIPESLPPADVDPHQFERVLVNLLSNALKYAPSPTRVVVGAAERQGELVVTVADCGPGIAPKDLRKVFDKYYRAAGTAKKEGLGIGLYGTRLLVQAHGGRIWAESMVGKGATFYVVVSKASKGERVASASLGSAARAGAAVLGAVHRHGAR